MRDTHTCKSSQINNCLATSAVLAIGPMGFANAASNAQVLKGFINLAAGQNLLALTEKQAIDVLSHGGNEQSSAA
jgi:hypothetical protein